MDAEKFHKKMEEVKTDIQNNQRDHYDHAEISDTIKKSIQTADDIDIDYKQWLEEMKVSIFNIQIYTKFLRRMHHNISNSYSSSSHIDGERNLIIVLEELAEFQEVIIDYLSGNDDHEHIIEEYADVMLILEYVKNICKIDDESIKTAIDVKIDRLNNTIEKEGTFK